MKENIPKDGNLQTTIDGNSMGNEDPEFITRAHVLMNVVVLDKIVRHLGFHDIRNFRLVSRRWNEVSEIVFWKMSRIKIINAEKESKNQFANFEQTFSFFGLPSQAIVFEGPLNHAALDYFLKDRFALRNIYFRSSLSNGYKIDLNYYLTRNVTTLRVNNSYCRISLESFDNIQNLHLDDCEIVLNGKITPRELTLGYSSSVIHKGRIFRLYDSHSQKILINDFVNFSKIKTLCLMGDIWNLDVGNGVIELENLEIPEAELIGLRNCQWTTNRFDFKKFVCVGDKMEIRLLYGKGDFDIDFGAFSNSIESWTLFPSRYHQLVDPQIFRYPNLKCLYLYSGSITFPILDFTNCTSLVKFGLHITSGIYKLDFNKIKLPTCIKRVKLCKVDVITETPWKLDTLILDNYSVSLVKAVIQQFKTVKLGINFDTALVQNEDITSILNILENSNIQKLAIGKVRWSDTNLFCKWICSSSALEDWVERIRYPIRGYYLFTKKEVTKGTPIDPYHFRELYYL